MFEEKFDIEEYLTYDNDNLFCSIISQFNSDVSLNIMKSSNSFMGETKLVLVNIL